MPEPDPGTVAASDHALPEPAEVQDSPWGLQQRLRRQLLAWIGGLWLVGTAAAMGGIWYETTEILDSALEETAQMLISAPEAVFAPSGEPPPGHHPHEEYVIYQVFDAQGAMRLRSHEAPLQPLDTDVRNGVRQVGPWHVLTLNSADGRRRALVAETRKHRLEVLWATAGWLLVALVVVLPLAAVAIRLLLTRAFATLEPARIELSLRLPNDHSPLNARGLPNELRPWMETINTLMARVRSTIDAERAFAAHTAHELRTPLAAARAQAQRLVSTTRDAAERDQAQSLVRQMDRITHLATRLLQLARIESGVAWQRDAVDLGELARLVVDEFPEAHRLQRLVLELSPEPVVVQGDLDALGIALRNLLDNALKHGGEGCRVTLRVVSDGLCVTDNGPGLAPQHLQTLGQKFARATSGVDGAGLGLAMVRTIAEQSDATLELQSPVSEGRGFRAYLRFRPPVERSWS